MIPFDYSRVTSLKSAHEAVARQASAQFIAGGTNLVDLMKKGVTNPQKLVDITGLPLKGIEQKGGVIRIGALALNSEVALSPLVREQLPLLAKAIEAGASPQIRNMATVGGNLLQRTRCPYFYSTDLPCNKRVPGSGCSALKGYNRMHAILGASDQCIAVHPSDMCVALAALDTKVVVSTGAGERKIPFLDFHRLPGTTPQLDANLKKGELITALEIRPSEVAGQSHYLKIRDRASYAFALVSVAVLAPGGGDRMNGVRIALGGVAHKPWRAVEAERVLQGKAPSEAVFEAAATAALRGAKGYGYNDFKIKLAANAMVQALKDSYTIS